MGLEVIFNNEKLSDYCRIEKIYRSVLPTRENLSKSIPSMMGSLYTGYHYAEKKIDIEISFVSFPNDIERMNTIRELARVLDVKKPCQIILSDEPDKHYFAVPDGSTDLDKESILKIKTKISFICHNPLAYSNEWCSYIPNDRKIFTMKNNGTAETYPHLTVKFSQSACFFQATNVFGQTLLVGRPKSAILKTEQQTNVVVNDNCSDSTGFTSLASSLLTSSRTCEGKLGIGNHGQSIVATNFGNEVEHTWCGGALRKNLNTSLSEFEVAVDVTFSSEGANYVPKQEAPVTKAPTSQTKSGKKSGSYTGKNYGYYKITAHSGLRIRSDANTGSSIKGCIPYGTEVLVKETKNGWGNVEYNGTQGWCSMQYMSKTRGTSRKREKENLSDYADNQMGLIEIYGYDRNGAILFINQIYDGTAYFEYVEPKIFLGSDKVACAVKDTVAPRWVKDKEGDNGHFDCTGAVGGFNDCVGKFVIKRTKAQNGKFLWSCSFYKYRGGQVINSISTGNNLSGDIYPKGELNSIGIYIAKFADHNPVSVMSVDNLRVTRLNPPKVGSSNLEIFNMGDTLTVDFERGLVKKNGQNFLTQLDIGSEFFSLPTGTSQMVCKSDDANIDVVCGFQERFL